MNILTCDGGGEYIEYTMVKSKVFTLCNLLMYVSLLGIGFSSFVISSNDNNNLSFNASFGDVNDILLSQSFNNEITITPYGFYNDETFNLSVTLNCEVNLDIDKAREEITSFNNALSLNVLLSEKDSLVTNFIDPNKITVSFDKAVTSNISNSLDSNSFISTIDISNIDDNDSTLSININYLIDTSTSITTNFNTDIYPSLQNGLNFVFQTEIIYG